MHELLRKGAVCLFSVVISDFFLSGKISPLPPMSEKMGITILGNKSS